MDTTVSSSIEYYINGVVIIVVASLGLLGNVLCIFLFVYRKMKMNPTFTDLLVWLAVLDSIFLTLVVLVFSLPQLSVSYKQWVFPFILPSLLPLTSIALTASVYTVVALTLERYFHLTRPQWSNKGSFFGYILPVLVFATCYNFPKFFEFTTERESDRDRTPYPQATEFRKNSEYSLYVLSVNFVLMGLVPFSILISVTVAITHHMKKFFNLLELREGYTTIGLLTSIVVVQLVCHTPRTGLNIYEVYTALQGERFKLAHTWVVDLSHLLLVISSSCNVVIYVIQDLRFRNLLMTDLKKCLLLYRSSPERFHQPPPEPALTRLMVGNESDLM